MPEENIYKRHVKVEQRPEALVHYSLSVLGRGYNPSVGHRVTESIHNYMSMNFQGRRWHVRQNLVSGTFEFDLPLDENMPDRRNDIAKYLSNRYKGKLEFKL